MPPPPPPPAGAPDPSKRAETVALFRYRVIAEAANPRLTAAERGRIVRALAASAHQHPDGTLRAYSRGTLDRWIVAYQARGLAGLRPVKRADAGVVRRHPELLGEAAALRSERPARSAAHIAEILRARSGITVSERTIRAHLARKGLDRAALAAEPARAFGRYEAERPNERWIGDVLVGPFVPHPRVAGSKRARLFLLVDDHSRLLVHGRWMAWENTRAGQDVLRAAIVRRGLPETLYVDNGAPYSNAALDRCCAVLGIRLVHSQPYWTSSTTASPPGPSRCSTPGSTPRPARPRSLGSWPAGRHGPPTRCCWSRRFAGRRSGWWPRPPPSGWPATATRSTPR